MDLSNLQGPPSGYRGQQWYIDAEFVIVQAIQPPKPYLGWNHTDAVTGLKGYTGEQLQAAREDGKKVGIYAWLWNTLADPYSDIMARLNIVPVGFPLDMRPWVDVEDTTATSTGQRQGAILRARVAADDFALQRGLPESGGYSGTWYVNQHLGGWWPHGWLKWWADYSQPAGALLGDDVVNHQFTSNPVDTDEMLESEIVEAGMAAIDFVPQDYQDKFGAKTPQDVYDNLEGIIHSLQAQQGDPAAAAKLAQIKAIVEA